MAAQVVDVALERLAPQQHVAVHGPLDGRPDRRAQADLRVLRVVHPLLRRDPLARCKGPDLRHRADPDRDSQRRPTRRTPILQRHLHVPSRILAPLLDDVLRMRSHEYAHQATPVEERQHLLADAPYARCIEAIPGMAGRHPKLDRHGGRARPLGHVAVRRLPEPDVHPLDVPQTRQAGLVAVQRVLRVVSPAVEHLEGRHLERRPVRPGRRTPPGARPHQQRHRYHGYRQRRRPDATSHAISSSLLAAIVCPRAWQSPVRHTDPRRARPDPDRPPPSCGERLRAPPSIHCASQGIGKLVSLSDPRVAPLRIWPTC